MNWLMFCDKTYDKDSPGLRLSLEAYGRKHTFESAYQDESLTDIFDGFFGMLIGATFTPHTVYSAFSDYVENLRPLYEEPEQSDQDDNTDNSLN